MAVRWKEVFLVQRFEGGSATNQLVAESAELGWALARKVAEKVYLTYQEEDLAGGPDEDLVQDGWVVEQVTLYFYQVRGEELRAQVEQAIAELAEQDEGEGSDG